MTVRIVTDSNTMIPAALARAHNLTVVPLIVTIDGDELVEDAELDVAATHRRLRAGAAVTTSAPAPGAFADAYASLAPAPIVSIHIGSAYSGTLNAARTGAELAGVDVRLVDTGTASFLAGCCVLAAAEVAEAGGDVDAVTAAAATTAADVASVFIVAELDRARAGGRVPVGQDSMDDGAPLLLMRGGEIVTLRAVHSADEAADAMQDHVLAIDHPLRLGIGDADAGPIVDDLAERLRAARPDDDVVRYVAGPSVAAHAGMGTFGVVYARR